MSLKEKATLYDGFTNIKRGMDSGNEPPQIGPDQIAFLVNGSSRKGYLTNRPGWFKHTLTGDSFQLGRWQGASGYIGPSGQPFIVASIGGKIVRFDPINNAALVLSTTNYLSNPTNRQKAWFCQAESYLAIQDNWSIPLVFDGGSLRRGNPVAFGGNEFPIGNAMEYNNGRLWVALPDRRSFSGGDLAYSVTGSASDVLTSTQNKFLISGSFALPSNAGLITAVKSLALQDSVLGQGPLIVFGEFGAATVNAPFDVTQWQNSSSPIVSVGLASAGPVSQESCVNVNGDLWFRAPDGVRSFMIARRDHNTWVNTPLSDEMDRVIDRDDPYLLQFASAALFANRRLETTSPYRATVDGVEYGIVWRGLTVLDFKPVSRMFDRSQPTWDGIWNGVGILQILTLRCYGQDRCFLFVLNSCYEIELWELSTNHLFDNLVDPIQWSIETRSFGFADQAESLKQLIRTETWIEQLVGSLSYQIQYRPDSARGWLELDSGSMCATSGLCTVGCDPPQAPLPQYRPRKISSGPAEDCEGCTDKPFQNGYEFQFRLTLNGSARLRRFRVVAQQFEEQPTGGCLSDEECCLQTGCEVNPWNYETLNPCAD